MEIENKYSRVLPEAYLKFLKENSNGSEIIFDEHNARGPDFEGRCWSFMSESELLGVWEMRGVGKIDLDRVESGFVIGEENRGYLYMDPIDDFSVWIYYHDGGDVLRIANSFKELINH